jgi:hypothetical protein
MADGSSLFRAGACNVFGGEMAFIEAAVIILSRSVSKKCVTVKKQREGMPASSEAALGFLWTCN